MVEGKSDIMITEYLSKENKIDPFPYFEKGVSDTKVSFEFFPAHKIDQEDTLWSEIKELEVLQPQFVSITFGAGGSTRETTFEWVKRVHNETNLNVAAHLTSICLSRDDCLSLAQQYWDMGVKRIVALRGDRPRSFEGELPKDAFQNAAELVTALKEIGDFDISVAAYPEKHPDARNLEEDIDFLKRKIDCGATRAITQFFFDTNYYLEFLNQVHKKNINIPIIPGILPINNPKSIFSFAEKCGSKIPQWLRDLFDDYDENAKERNKLIAATVAAEQCRLLQANGINQFHFYTLNQSDLVYSVCRLLGLSPKEKLISQAS